MQGSIVFLVRVQCRRKESSHSLSHLLMSFLCTVRWPCVCLSTDTVLTSKQNVTRTPKSSSLGPRRNCHDRSHSVKCEATAVLCLIMYRRSSSLCWPRSFHNAHQDLWWMQSDLCTGRKPGVRWRRTAARSRKTWCCQIWTDVRMSPHTGMPLSTMTSVELVCKGFTMMMMMIS